MDSRGTMSSTADEKDSAQFTAEDCVCHVPTPPDTFSASDETLDSVLRAETESRLQRRAQEATATGEDAFPYNSVFAPHGLLPYKGLGTRKLCMEDDSVVAGIRAQLRRERNEAEEVAAAMEEAQLAALELKCMMLQTSKPS